MPVIVTWGQVFQVEADRRGKVIDLNELVVLKELGQDIFKDQLRLQVGHVWDNEGFLGMG